MKQKLLNGDQIVKAFDLLRDFEAENNRRPTWDEAGEIIKEASQ